LIHIPWLKNELFNELLEKLKKKGNGVFDDIACGTVLSALVSFAVFQVAKWIN
jgi:hypothetical protein